MKKEIILSISLLFIYCQLFAQNKRMTDSITVIFLGKFNYNSLSVYHAEFGTKEVQLNQGNYDISGIVKLPINKVYKYLTITHGTYILCLDLDVYPYQYLYIIRYRDDIIYITANTKKPLKIN